MQKTLISLFFENFFPDSESEDNVARNGTASTNNPTAEIIPDAEFSDRSDVRLQNIYGSETARENKRRVLTSALLIRETSNDKTESYSVLFSPGESVIRDPRVLSAIDLSKSTEKIIRSRFKSDSDEKTIRYSSPQNSSELSIGNVNHALEINEYCSEKGNYGLSDIANQTYSKYSGHSRAVLSNCTVSSSRTFVPTSSFTDGKIGLDGGGVASSTSVQDSIKEVPFFDLQCGSEQISSTQDPNGNSNNSTGSASSTIDTKPKNLKCQECKICGRVLSSLASYYVHMKSHSDNKPYRCTYCEICFTRKPYLEVHLRTHTGERPFKCTLCDKTFTQKSSLNTHLRVHSGDKPFSCDICHKSFALKSYLSAHRWSHVGEANSGVSCDLCGEVFTSRPQAAAHIRTHTAFACSLCHRSFTKQSFLVRHVARAHPERRLIDLDKRRKLLMDDDDSDRESMMTATPPPPPVTPVLAASRTNSPSPFHPSVRDIGTQNILDSPRYDRSGRDSPLMTPKPLQLSQPSPQPLSAPSSSNKSKHHHKSNVSSTTSCHNLQQRSVHTSTSLAGDNPSSNKQPTMSSSKITPMSQVAFPGAPYNVGPANFTQPSDFPNRTCSLSPVQSYHIMVPTPCHTYPPPTPYPPVSVPTPPPTHRGSPSTSLYTSHLTRPSHQRPSQ